MEKALIVENVGKMYRLGTVGTGTLSHDLNRFWHKIRGKEDPYTKVGQENNRAAASDNPYVWALKDINFTVDKGEVLGIIGKNGAGKSTLLKILSKITSPTTGSIKVNGRIASLLEVGTGFHPELTGRENIYLNGAILGMKRHEIKAKFDEIVEFSGCERYLDTPVKRYSSGMYVRLAFAVAAHLESEILIVDEVLAVGDAEFQKKCLGKMKDVSSNEGRTVLFVSHNITAVKGLCHNAIIMEAGKIGFQGDVLDATEEYLKLSNSEILEKKFSEFDLAPGNSTVKLKSCSIEPLTPTSIINVRTPLKIKFSFWWAGDDSDINLSLHLFDSGEVIVFNIHTPIKKVKKGIIEATCEIPANLLNDNTYSVNIMVVLNGTTAIYDFKDCLRFKVDDFRENYVWHGKWPGLIRPTTIPFNFENNDTCY